MMTFQPLAAGVVLVTLVSVMAVPFPDRTAGDAVGREYPPEWRVVGVEEDAENRDFEVVQLTTDDAMDNKMYLRTTNYVPSLDSIVFMSNRYENAQNLFLMSLEDGSFVQLTASEHTEGDDEIDGEHANVSPATEEVFFKQGDTLKRVSLHPPYRETEIYEQENPEWDLRATPSLSSDGNTIATIEYNKDKERSRIVTVDVTAADPETETIATVDGKADHVWINPDASDTIIYHLGEGPNEHEVGLVDIPSGDVRVISRESDDAHGVHPFWLADGVTAGYMYKRDDHDDQLKTYDIRTGDRVNYDLPDSHSHASMNPAGSRIVGDGKSRAGESYIYYYGVSPDGELGRPLKMFDHGSCMDHGEQLHPHAEFINRTDVIFNSDGFFLDDPDGDCESIGDDAEDATDGNIYLLRKLR